MTSASSNCKRSSPEIFSDRNLNVGRYYKAGDGVVDPNLVNRNWVKGLSLYDKRIIELQKEFARNLLRSEPECRALLQGWRWSRGSESGESQLGQGAEPL